MNFPDGLLEALEAGPASLIANWQSIDPRVRNMIEGHYPGGWMALEQGMPKPDLLLKAIRDAKASLPKPRRGRPTGTRDEASRGLAIALRAIFEGHGDQPATRRKRPERGGAEYGPFRDFVEEVMSVLPPSLRRTAKGGQKSVDHLVRLAMSRPKPRR